MKAKYILYNPLWKDLRCVEKTLDEKPATWQRFEDEVGGKQKILDMEIKEYREAKEKADDGKLSVKEKYKTLKHVAAAAVQAMYALREENHGRV